MSRLEVEETRHGGRASPSLRGAAEPPLSRYGDSRESGTTCGPGPMINALVFTTLYPNSEQPHHGIFVENRLRHLLSTGEVQARVVAPVPYFPWQNPRFGTYGAFARVPSREERHGVTIRHPRFPVIPKVGTSLSPLLLYLAMRRFAASGALDPGAFDVIDAHYFYPDGVAAAMLARAWGKPLVVTARGTDVNLLPEYPMARRQILRAAARADAVNTVCEALKHRLVELGVGADKITVLRNGVDLEAFRPADRAAARAKLGLSRPTLISVGHLIPRKGHDVAVRALARIPEAELLIAGEGPERNRLEVLAGELGVHERVHLLGRVPHEELPELYSAADALVLASSREGWANVLLEAMACGTPVVASDVWGTAEVVRDPAAGTLVPERTPEAFAAAINRLLAEPPDRGATRAYAEGLGWDDTSKGQLRVFRSILGRSPAESAAGAS